MMVLGLIDNFMPIVYRELSLWQFHMMRTSMMCLLLVVVSSVLGQSLWPKSPFAVIQRSMFYSASMVIYFGAIGAVSVATAGAGLMTGPLFIVIFSVLFWNQTVGWVRVAAVIAGFVGVILILQPFSDGFEPLAAFPVFAGALYGFALLLTGQKCAQEHTLTMIFWLFLFMGIWGAIGFGFSNVFPYVPLIANNAFLGAELVWPSQTIWLVIAVQVFGSLFAIFCQTRGYQIADATILGVFEYSFLISAGFFGWLLWNASFGAVEIAGMGLIAMAGVVVALRSQKPKQEMPAS